MPRRITITEAAFRLGLSYQQTRDRLLKGDLRGGRDDDGRLYVDARDIERLQTVSPPRGRPSRTG